MKNLKVFLKMVMFLPLVTAIGCFNLEPQSRTVEDLSSQDGDAIYDLVPLPLSAGPGTVNKKTSVLNFRTVGKSYESLTGVSPVGGFTTGDPNIFLEMPNYSINSQADSVNSGMELSLIRLAGAVCLKLVKKEAAMTGAASSGRKFFKSFNFNQASESQNIDNAIKESTNTFSQNVCGFPGSTTVAAAGPVETVAVMMSRKIRESFAVDDVSAPGPDTATAIYGGSTFRNTGDAALMTCSAFLASACTLVHN